MSPVVEVLEADYLVVGAGAAGMAFTDALIDHADAHVVMVDRRHSVGGHWLDAYPFVRLHQASAFYGVASTPLGEGLIQPDGPEAGLHERATAPEICAYRLGHLQHVEPTRLVFGEGEVATAKDAVIVHCAASGLQYQPLVPIWGDEAITLQPIRTGFPCFGAALAGYVEATLDGDEEKNRSCPPSPYSNTPADWARMQVLGNQASMSFASQPDIKAWANRVSLNPARIPPDLAGSAEVTAAMERFRTYIGAGMARMAKLGGMS